jgi:hypothetical protein
MRYYKPEPKDIEIGMQVEMYVTTYHRKADWRVETVGDIPIEEILHELDKDNIRVKYLDELDFNEVGYTLKRIHLGTQINVIDIIEHDDKEDEEITEEIDIFNEDMLIILKGGIPVGKFYPYLPTKNVEYKSKTHSIKNLYELRKILK